MAPPATLLIVDDDENFLYLLKKRLESAEYKVIAVSEGEGAMEAIRSEHVDLSLLDLQLANKDGISLMQEIHAVEPRMPVIILTGHGTIPTAVEAVQKGAYSYLTKPYDPDELLITIARALENSALTREVERLQGTLERRYGFDNIVARSKAMRDVLDAVSRIAGTDCTVLLQGESGTGKEVIARAIHFASARKNRPFVAINCASIPETLLESNLFGHERGAFTGAVRKTKGLFSAADKGTVLLDEIGDMPMAVQAKLLRFLQERRFYPLGSETTVEVDVRVIASTNKDLEGEVRKGSFREDLFYRIHVVPLHLPPLRERKEDIPPLVEHFLARFSRQMNKEIEGLSPGAMERLMSHQWPGNVRELENTIEYAVAMAKGRVIEEELILPARGASPVTGFAPLKDARESFEKDYIVRLLEVCGGNVSRAARLAGKYRADFYELMKRYGVKASAFKKPEGV
jgi:two-component system response regulator GlrR